MKYLNIFFKEQIIRSENLYLKKNPHSDLIYNSALSIFNFIEKEFNRKKFLFICGPGNNGKDGKKVCEMNSKRNSFLLLDIESNTKNIQRLIKECDIIVDAIFGFGLNRTIDNSIAKIINCINKSKKKIISIDLPSGVEVDSGKIFNIAVRSDLTLALGFFKPAHFLNPGKYNCGTKKLLKLNLPFVKSKKINLKIIDKNIIEKKKFKFKNDIHKYQKGSVLVYGGKMSGASRLVALSSRKIGAGLSTIYVDQNNLKYYAGTEPGTIIDCSEKINLNKVNSIVIGPGLGKDFDKSKIINILKRTSLPIVIDADALSIFSNEKENFFNILKNRKKNILTPHEGEFKKLFGFKGNSKIDDSIKASKLTSSVIVYKGNDTIIANPLDEVWINVNATNSLATAGTGDILSGIIAGLLAKGKKLTDACIIANWILGDMSQNKNNVTAEDFVDQINFYNNCLNNN